jgi:PAS domain S-box-containing protein
MREPQLVSRSSAAARGSPRAEAAEGIDGGPEPSGGATRETRCRALFERMDTGLCVIEIVRDDAGVAVDYRFVEVNAAFERHTGLLDATGRTARELVPGLEPHWVELYARVAATGVPVRLESPSAAMGRSFDVHAFRLDEPGGPRVAVLFDDVTDRRRAEARLAAFLDNSPGSLFVKDAHGRYVLVNRSFLARAGRPQEQILGRADAELFGPALAEAFVAGDRAALAAGAPTTAEESFVYEGRPYTFLTQKFPLPGGETGGVSTDITGRKAAEAALRASEDRFRSFAEASADAVYVVDAAARRLEYLSPAFERIWGIPRDAVLADIGRWAASLHPDDRERELADQERFYAGPEPRPVEREYRIVRAGDGAVRHIRDKASPILDASGRLARVAGIAQDVTERRQAAAQLAASERWLRTLMEGIPQLVWRATAGGSWTWAGPQWQAFTGLAEAASLGQGWLAAVHPDDRAAALAGWRAAGDDGAYAADYRVRRAADGAWRWFQTRATPVRGEPAPGALDEPPVEWLGTSTDVEDQMQARAALARSADELEARVAARTAELLAAEASLREAQKLRALRQLTGGVAHDFNNLMAVVQSGVQLIERHDDPALRGRVLDGMRSAVDRGVKLTRQLLAFARRQVLDPEPVDLASQGAALRERLERSPHAGVRVELSLPPDLWPVEVDPGELELALWNLCLNAAEAMPGGGVLSVSAANAPGASAAEDRVALRVADTGAGMSPQVVARAFEPFFTTKEVGEGSGMGLAQVNGFAEQSRGSVEIASEVGRGTVVTLRLPRAARAPSAEPAAAAPPPAAATATAGRHVLLVEDDPTVAALTVEMLAATGFSVTHVAGPAAALALLEAPDRAVDIVLSDVMMPGGSSGLDLAREVRRAHPDLPVVLITGYPAAAADAVAEGFELLRKPVELDVLAATLAARLDRPRPV